MLQARSSQFRLLIILIVLLSENYFDGLCVKNVLQLWFKFWIGFRWFWSYSKHLLQLKDNLSDAKNYDKFNGTIIFKIRPSVPKLCHENYGDAPKLHWRFRLVPVFVLVFDCLQVPGTGSCTCTSRDVTVRDDAVVLFALQMKLLPYLGRCLPVAIMHSITMK